LLQTLLNNNNNNNNNNNISLNSFFKVWSNNEEPIKDNHKNKQGQNNLDKYKYHHVKDSYIINSRSSIAGGSVSGSGSGSSSSGSGGDGSSCVTSSSISIV
jgi:hypothetical protein